MTAAGGALPATRQPDKEPSTAGAGVGGSGVGSTLHPSSTPQPWSQGSSATGAPQPSHREPSATAKSLWRKSPEHFASWPDLEHACTHTPGQQPPSARGKAAPSGPPLPARAHGQRQAALAPALTCCGPCCAGQEWLREGHRLGCSSLPYIPPKYSRPGAADSPAGASSGEVWQAPAPASVQLALPRNAEPTAASPPSATVPIPQPQRHLSHPCPQDPRQRRLSGVKGAGGTQGMGPLPAAALPRGANPKSDGNTLPSPRRRSGRRAPAPCH